MPKIFLFEECVSAGARSPLGQEIGVFLPEGMAMLTTLADDLASLPGVTVTVLIASEWESQFSTDTRWHKIFSKSPDLELRRLAARHDGCIVIAPEVDGLLARRAEQVLQAGGILYGSRPEEIRIASDKNRLAELLLSQQVPIPRGCPFTPELELPFDFPVIVKPADGAGADGVRRVDDRATWNDVRMQMSLHRTAWRVEQYCPGRAASIAVLVGAQNVLYLPAGEQLIQFAANGCASYDGGILPLNKNEQQRAEQLARTVVKALPALRGYIGIDLVLGDATDGSQDVVIEINPRLTTAYLGLREVLGTSLAAAWLQICNDQPCGDIPRATHRVKFDKFGRVERVPFIE
jgi:tyramine---L-glutamate ligase